MGCNSNKSYLILSMKNTAQIVIEGFLHLIFPLCILLAAHEVIIVSHTEANKLINIVQVGNRVIC